MSTYSVRLIIDSVNRRWILGKIAERLAEHLKPHGVEADVGEQPRRDVDVNHWMFYAQPWRHHYGDPGFFSPEWRPLPTKHTAMITHVDDPLKLKILRESMPKILDAGICMSSATMKFLVSSGIDPQRLTYIVPAHDAAAEPRRILIGITSRLYADARKGEADLLQLARAMPLDAFRFEIIGEGWDAVAEVLRQAGAEVDLSGSEGGYPHILDRLPHFDYYLYLGWDEGSMGTIDALAAGIKTIVTPQGFHLDLARGITHMAGDFGELQDLFSSIAAERQQRIDSVRELTWDAYARKHALVWRALLAGEPPPEVEANAGTPPADYGGLRRRMRRRIARSEFWKMYLESRKFWVRGKLSRAKRWLFRRKPAP